MQNLLLINRSGPIRQILVRLIRSSELPLGEIYEAANAQEGLETLSQRAIGLILLDVSIPDMKELRALVEAQQTATVKHMPIIIISADASRGTVLEALKLGAEDYISRPFTTDHIREKLMRLL